MAVNREQFITDREHTGQQPSDALLKRNALAAENQQAAQSIDQEKSAEAQRLMLERQARIAAYRQECIQPDTTPERARELFFVLLAEDPQIELDRSVPFNVEGTISPREVISEVWDTKVGIHHAMHKTKNDHTLTPDERRQQLLRAVSDWMHERKRVELMYLENPRVKPIAGEIKKGVDYAERLLAGSPHLTGINRIIPEPKFASLLPQQPAKR